MHQNQYCMQDFFFASNGGIGFSITMSQIFFYGILKYRINVTTFQRIFHEKTTIHYQTLKKTVFIFIDVTIYDMKHYTVTLYMHFVTTFVCLCSYSYMITLLWRNTNLLSLKHLSTQHCNLTKKFQVKRFHQISSKCNFSLQKTVVYSFHTRRIKYSWQLSSLITIIM